MSVQSQRAVARTAARAEVFLKTVWPSCERGMNAPWKKWRFVKILSDFASERTPTAPIGSSTRIEWNAGVGISIW